MSIRCLFMSNHRILERPERPMSQDTSGLDGLDRSKGTLDKLVQCPGQCNTSWVLEVWTPSKYHSKASAASLGGSWEVRETVLLSNFYQVSQLKHPMIQSNDIHITPLEMSWQSYHYQERIDQTWVSYACLCIINPWPPLCRIET